ncbi:hypothetical protein FPSE_07044 [Fusarium pseudograminearum CS3096]|uniref:Uncharacterized protein n=1 Tax=Fusarium pseudograminearum (strain CS3096) TaxID=1028729 RepID=K3VI53_FUSPC|nr:hypothetical protein FPSE_07044 [Fusarium pseudograminearum CS3096]EKJ72778.1 hypothetical protein FPSE_07044 [Fusarium pseudograminearum CS3096]
MSNTNSSSDRAQIMDDMAAAKNGEALNAMSPTSTPQSRAQLILALEALLQAMKQMEAHLQLELEANAQGPA